MAEALKNRGDGLQSRADVHKGLANAVEAPSLDHAPESLMAGYQGGDPAAATALIHLLSPALHRYFLADAGSRAHADDLLQETWLRIHRVRHTYQRGEPVSPWFYAIARHVRIDHYRKILRTTAREEKLAVAAQIAAASPSNQPPLEDLDHLLGSLPAKQREALEMLKVAGMSLEEVARATSSTVGSVKQRVHRAYKRLRQSMFVMRTQRRKNGALP